MEILHKKYQELTPKYIYINFMVFKYICVLIIKKTTPIYLLLFLALKNRRTGISTRDRSQISEC